VGFVERSGHLKPLPHLATGRVSERSEDRFGALSEITRRARARVRSIQGVVHDRATEPGTILPCPIDTRGGLAVEYEWTIDGYTYESLMGHLEQQPEVHMKIATEILQADGCSIYPLDIIAIGVFQRSISLIKGFRAMVESGNALAAYPLLRIQLDTAMRFFAFSLVDDHMALHLHLMEDKPLRDFPGREGRKLSDRYLHEKLSQHYPWVTKVYETTSGYVHFSGRHLAATVVGTGPDEGKIRWHIGYNGPIWPEEARLEAVHTFMNATQALSELGIAYLREKRGFSSADDPPGE
jgi:hypothetical protein